MKTKLLLLLTSFIAFLGISSAQNALNFDGTNDVVQTTSAGVLASADRTFEAWINVSANAPSSNLTILDYGLNAAGSRNTFIIDGNRNLRFISGGTNGNLPASNVSIPTGQWTHVAFVLDNGTGYLYINGVQTSTGNLSGVNTPSGNANVTIGERVSGSSIPFNGAIDEVRIWNTARTPSQIVANMFSELCSNPSDLIAYYKFNQGIASGNNTNLTNVIGELGDTAIATNFSMMGALSNWVAGASITAITPLNLGISVDTLTQTLSSNDSSLNTHYQWFDCALNSILPGDTNRAYTSRNGGTYAVILSNGNCIDTSACINVNFSSGGNSPGKALYFDGTNDHVLTTFPGVLDSTDRTFEAWVNVSTTAPSSNLAILDYGLNAVGSRNTFTVNGSRGLSFISGGTNANIGSTANVITAGQWTHVAFVLDNGTGYLYANGVQVGTGNLSTVNTPSANTSVILGQRVTGGSIPFNGAIDEVRIWNVARTQAEILANMNTEYCGQATGLVAQYSMNQGIASGNNTSILKVFNSLNSGDGILTNFSLTGSTSNFISPGALLSPPLIDTTISQVGVTLTSNDTTADHYQWFDCNSQLNLIGDTSRSFVSSANGNYSVILTKNGCMDTSACINVISVGLESINNKHFFVSQNPVKDRFQLSNPYNFQINTNVRSTTGRLVNSIQSTNLSKIEINLESEPSGLYILTIEEENGSITTIKVIKY